LRVQLDRRSDLLLVLVKFAGLQRFHALLERLHGLLAQRLVLEIELSGTVAGREIERNRFLGALLDPRELIESGRKPLLTRDDSINAPVQFLKTSHALAVRLLVFPFSAPYLLNQDLDSGKPIASLLH